METILKLAKSNHFSISFCRSHSTDLIAHARRDQDQIWVVKIIELKLHIKVRSLWMNRLSGNFEKLFEVRERSGPFLVFLFIKAKLSRGFENYT